MKRNKHIKEEAIFNPDVNIMNTKEVQNFISKALEQSAFNKFAIPKETEEATKNAPKILENAKFISVVKEEKEILSEAEFYEIVSAKNGRLSPHAGRFQKSLYSHYKQALKEKDNGYRTDVLLKAKMLKENILCAQKLMQNELFMKKWKENVGKITPVRDLQENGRMQRINIVRYLIEE